MARSSLASGRRRSSTEDGPTLSEIAVGAELPPLVKRPDREQLVKYAAGSGDFNPLHYDADFP